MAVWLLGLITAFMLALSGAASRTVDRNAVETTIGARARTSFDEILRELRAGRQVLASAAANGATVWSSDTDIVFQAPAYDPASPAVLLATNDVVAFDYDSQAKTITETVVRTAGSRRPARAGLVIARNVESVAYTYYAQDQFAGDGATTTFTLNAKAKTGTTPTLYVNGVAAPCVYVPLTRQATLASAPAKDADVQFLYLLDPAQDSGAWLPQTDRVDATLTLSNSDGRRITRRVTLSGNARLRNRRG